ncbi:MAG: tRNA (adenosine(37)-N6)-dimethylallyltransferase MiaA [Clostridia bacterium]|nr:tRNA (adenosine(37)-N6)-dimethylallyltransferase MiaA [Clostridia bacterium]
MSKYSHTLLCLSGPTAVGKSDIAMEIARRLGSDIISADSMQIYRGMDIGTAKPTKLDQGIIKHHMIDIINCDEEYSSYMYKEAVDGIIAQHEESQQPSLIVGGTAFYLDSLLYKLDFEVNGQTIELRDRLLHEYTERGAQYLHDKLHNLDPQSAERIHPNNVKRVIRAIEVASMGGSLSNARDKCSRYNHVLFALSMNRPLLYERINNRVDTMVKQGLIEEVQNVYADYHDRRLQALQGIGYKEIIQYLEGEITLSDSVDLIKRHSRNYAKRQLTFLKRLNPIWLDVTSTQSNVIDTILDEYYMKSSYV